MTQPLSKSRFDLGNTHVIDRPEGKQKAGIRLYKTLNWLSSLFIKTVKFQDALLNFNSAKKYILRNKNILALAVPQDEQPNLDQKIAHLTTKKAVKYLGYLKTYTPSKPTSSPEQVILPQPAVSEQPIANPTPAPLAPKPSTTSSPIAENPNGSDSDLAFSSTQPVELEDAAELVEATLPTSTAQPKQNSGDQPDSRALNLQPQPKSSTQPKIDFDYAHVTNTLNAIKQDLINSRTAISQMWYGNELKLKAQTVIKTIVVDESLNSTTKHFQMELVTKHLTPYIEFIKTQEITEDSMRQFLNRVRQEIREQMQQQEKQSQPQPNSSTLPKMDIDYAHVTDTLNAIKQDLINSPTELEKKCAQHTLTVTAKSYIKLIIFDESLNSTTDSFEKPLAITYLTPYIEFIKTQEITEDSMRQFLNQLREQIREQIQQQEKQSQPQPKSSTLPKIETLIKHPGTMRNTGIKIANAPQGLRTIPRSMEERMRRSPEAQALKPVHPTSPLITASMEEGKSSSPDAQALKPVHPTSPVITAPIGFKLNKEQIAHLTKQASTNINSLKIDDYCIYKNKIARVTNIDLQNNQAELQLIGRKITTPLSELKQVNENFKALEEDYGIIKLSKSLYLYGLVKNGEMNDEQATLIDYGQETKTGKVNKRIIHKSCYAVVQKNKLIKELGPVVE